MNKNDICTLKITGISNDGSGVGRDTDGKVVFVPMTAVGDICRVKILKVHAHPVTGLNIKRLPCFRKMRRLFLPPYQL